MLTTDQQDDKKFIQDPGRWPNWPFLPMKKKGENGLDGGLLIDTQPITKYIDKDHKSLRLVFTVYFWEMATEPEKFREKIKDPNNQKQYDSIDAMLADGWQVD